MRKALLLVPVIALLIANISLAEEIDIKEDESQNEIGLSALSTGELETRLEEVEGEVDELELKQEYMRSEEPIYLDYSPSAVERRGFVTKDEVNSKLLNPMATKDIERRLERLYRLKEAIEKELDKRGE
ncbi:MAG: hypothetical protein HZA30_00955 [Candidatus Omnitrophica bacterium]|nr:hypothetical protein [Candidatus Omnitrophota bacterium]